MVQWHFWWDDMNIDHIAADSMSIIGNSQASSEEEVR
jgi:hypothetical protein